jgi:PleD family two-component response regulator
LRLAEQLKEKLREIRVTLESARPFGMTVSLGVAIGRREDVGQDLSALIRQADLMLYRAKRGGEIGLRGLGTDGWLSGGCQATVSRRNWPPDTL